jgi:hypothetical protein
MTFLTLLVVLTQAVSVGVVDKPLVLANGTRLMPGDRVLAIHDSTHPWLTFLPSGEFLPLDSSKVVISGNWQAPDVLLRDHPEGDSGAWIAPDRWSQRVPWRTQVLQIRFLRADFHYHEGRGRAEFCYRDSSFWGPLAPREEWFPLSHKEVLGSMPGFGRSPDSSRARVLIDLADAMLLGRTNRPDSARDRIVARLYELGLEVSKRQGDQTRAANSLLSLAAIETGRRHDSAALAHYERAASEFAGVKSIYGRADVYAYWQMMELAWRHRDTAHTSSFARKIIIDYPTEMAEARVITGVGESPTLEYAKRSIWFDVNAADRLLQAAGDDESQAAPAAEFLTRSTSLAVRYQGFRRLTSLSMNRSDTTAALSHARTALALPHYWQLEVWPRSGDIHPGGSERHDFKDEFIDSLDVLLPFADLLHLYDSTYNLKDAMMARDAANWFMRQVEQGRTPPRGGILNRIEPPRNPIDFRRDLLASMTDAPQFRTALECTLFIHRPDDYPDRGRASNQVLPKGSLLQPYVMREGLIRVATPDGFSGWTNARSLRGAPSVWDIPAVEMPEPVASADFDGDGVRDLRLSTTGVFIGKGLVAVRPPDRNNSWLRQIGVFRRKWVELRGDTLCLYGVGADTVAKYVPVSRKAKRGMCKPGSCFYFVAVPDPNDSFAWVSAVRERGTIWTTPLPIGTRGADVIYQVDTTLIITGGDSAWVLSAANGAPRGRIATHENRKSWRGVFFNRSGYAVAKDDSIIYHDYSGSRELGVAVGNSDTKLFPPFAPSFESDIWGVTRFGRSLCPIASEAVPVVSIVLRHDGERWFYDIAMHLISLLDGRELATIAMSENYYDCHYDEHGVYVSDDTGFRAVTWEGKPLAVADLPLLSYPIWDGDRIVSYFSRPMGTMFEAGAASRLAEAVRPLKSRWPAMDDRRQYGE